ncbi:MAG: methylenetetrahydrofolate reductase, partial [Bdellovibrionales bacterium]|nr:methylenetetrahydrofolate reductase [Bdellovibrionales bacterium]
MTVFGEQYVISLPSTLKLRWTKPQKGLRSIGGSIGGSIGEVGWGAYVGVCRTISLPSSIFGTQYIWNKVEFVSFSNLYSHTRPIFSFEFFPPKRQELIDETRKVMERIRELNPDYMTVTYGAGGGTRELTRELTAFIAKELQIPAVAHLTCVG